MTNPPTTGQPAPQPPAPGQPVGPGQPPPGQPYAGQPYPVPTPPEPRRGLSTGLAILLFVGIPLLLIALLIAGVINAVGAFRGTAVTQNVDANAGNSLLLDTPNAAIRLTPSDDEQIHVSMRGSYSGERPRLEVGASGDETEIRGGCPDGWFFFNRCRVQIEVSLPEDLDVTAIGQNGSITADELTGDLDLSTTNGGIGVDGSSGVLVLHTTNGRIQLDDADSTEVRAETTNGAVHLAFSDAPDDVTANSTNGEIRIVVPDDGTEYYVEADTTNGRVDTEDVPGDRQADRVISAGTTNGNITIETTRRR